MVCVFNFRIQFVSKINIASKLRTSLSSSFATEMKKVYNVKQSTKITSYTPQAKIVTNNMWAVVNQQTL